MSENLLAPFLAHAERQADRIAITDARQSITYKELADRSSEFASFLVAKGIKKDDRVLLARPVNSGLFITLAALWRIGATIVFPEPALGLAGLKHAVDIAEPDYFLCSGKYRFLKYISKPIRCIPKHIAVGHKQVVVEKDLSETAVSADDAALISFTSGSTGQPKAIVRSHGFLLAQSKCLTPLLGQVEKDDIDLVAFPMFVVANLAIGLTSVLPDWKFSAHDKVSVSHLKAFIKTHKITRALVPPILCEALADISGPPTLRAIFTGGGPVFPDLLKRLNQSYPQADIVSVYGSTEAEPISHAHFKDLTPVHFEKMKSGAGLFAGTPISEISLRLEEKEILVSGDHVNKGYMNGVGDAENKRKIDGLIWHRTGDAGYMDDDGLWLLGRHSAKTAGFYPFQVETAARSWSGVSQAALCEMGGAVLALSGEEPSADAWQVNASKIGDINVVQLDQIPMDKRHRSKVDYVALRQAIERAKERAKERVRH